MSTKTARSLLDVICMIGLLAFIGCATTPHFVDHPGDVTGVPSPKLYESVPNATSYFKSGEWWNEFPENEAAKKCPRLEEYTTLYGETFYCGEPTVDRVGDCNPYMNCASTRTPGRQVSHSIDHETKGFPESHLYLTPEGGEVRCRFFPRPYKDAGQGEVKNDEFRVDYTTCQAVMKSG